MLRASGREGALLQVKPLAPKHFLKPKDEETLNPKTRPPLNLKP